MSGTTNAQKTYIADSWQRFVEGKIRDALQQQGKELPCEVVAPFGNTGALYTVKFDVNAAPFNLPQLVVPLFGPEFVRYPIQPGCKGVVFSADARLGGVTGLGSGTPSLAQPANLSALVFFPVANTGWSATDDPRKLVLYGPDGAVLRDATNGSSVVVTAIEALVQSGATVRLKVGANTITVSSSGIDIEGALTINGAPFAAHEHTLVQTGTDTSGPVAP